MSHFKFESDMNNLLKMDAPITKGPPMRWQRKQSEALGASMNCSISNVSMNGSICKTPMKPLNKSLSNSLLMGSKTPSGTNKTPGLTKTPGKNKTPSRGSKTPKTPSGGDRFIPNRGATQFDVGHYKLMTEKSVEDEMLSPSKREYQRAMNENLNGDAANAKIIAYKNKAPQAPEGYQNNLKVLYSSQNKTPGSCKKPTRHIPQVPERILDAPEILDDYYLNLLDWSVNNHLAVALGGHVYLWNAGSGEIEQLLELENPEDYVSSVSWIKEGNYLAVGNSSNEVQLWDVQNMKRVRNMTGHAARVGALSWNSYILSSGSRSGAIHHHDVRVPHHHIATLLGHTQEVCGLKWSPDGRFLASGGNDNLLNIWQADMGQSEPSPVLTFSQHQAAVKAVAWCPWQPSVLASGGGTADRHIRFWNVNTGACLSSVDTKSQVCSILWSKEYKELVSGHGFAQNQLIIWKYPSMTKVSELTGHTARVLHLSMSPDGSTVVSAAADETLRLWKCFDVDAKKKKTAEKSSVKKGTNTLMRQSIR
ncbi:cell division cycle protein 20 homolog [Lingula anatina]|uniref:Cell division cycle protein 20 homolog n=1 Tax=Lingula anatina TaxID=7574 RepID=A0A1S3JGW5_LINAN|nr:cell division cycle protein 20 homolog [Lingula anatina]XP_013409652.1 cell division cycle protein 20 homolog [Lingula anatina]|eukprot:XP_013409650.1 cell division cycle protein 20 homolog [Lingula anatina]